MSSSFSSRFKPSSYTTPLKVNAYDSIETSYQRIRNKYGGDVEKKTEIIEADIVSLNKLEIDDLENGRRKSPEQNETSQE
jgi:hypothetical protein